MPTKHRRIFQRRTRSRPDANQLETFLNGAEARSFAEAARQLSISQPSCLKLDDQVPAAKLMRGKGRPGRIRSNAACNGPPHSSPPTVRAVMSLINISEPT